MNILEKLKHKIQKKKARRITSEYTSTVQSFDLSKEGVIQFANWDNPLVRPTCISQQMVDFFKKFIRPGDLAIDIGANIGDTTVPIALAAGKPGLTLGFDPNPFVFKVLEKNATLNPGKQNIVPLRYAITAKEEAFFYISSEASFGNGGISPTKESRHGKFVYPEKIKGVNLQDYLEKNHANNISRLSFIKIDTEGYDKEIIKSISPLLRKYKPAIVAESFGNNSNDEKSELFDTLANLDYDIFYFEDFDINTKIIQLNNNQEITQWKKTINIYGVSKTK